MKLNTILLVDDDNINNFLNERLIRKLNITRNIKVTMNGAEGMDFLRENCEEGNPNCPDLIFLDINMPVMDGFDFIRAFDGIKMKTKAKIIILTTSKNPKDLERLKTLGDFEYINKPLTQEKLINCLANVHI
jgi:CheY-like chemotaxis protein